MDYILEIKTVMLREGLKADDLCSLWGVSRSQVSAILNKRAELSVDRFQSVMDRGGIYLTTVSKPK